VIRQDSGVPRGIHPAFPYLAFTLFIASTLPVATVPHYHTVYLKAFIGQAALVAGLVTIADRPPRLTPFIWLVFAALFGWYHPFGIPSGLA
jgi:hypothetical protein